jgi:FKBP-type peptidyl-prolyl cis-trans isomerase
MDSSIGNDHCDGRHFGGIGRSDHRHLLWYYQWQMPPWHWWHNRFSVVITVSGNYGGGDDISFSSAIPVCLTVTITCTITRTIKRTISEPISVTINATISATIIIIATDKSAHPVCRDYRPPRELAHWYKLYPDRDRHKSTVAVCGQRQLSVPSKLGYGKRSSAPDIPPNADLFFVVTLSRRFENEKNVPNQTPLLTERPLCFGRGPVSNDVLFDCCVGIRY